MFHFFTESPGTPNKPSSVECFIHNVSPVKTSNNGKRQYFNCTLQCEDKVVRAVCFSPEKQTQVKTVELTKTPVRLQNFWQNDTDPSKDIFITKYTQVTPLTNDQVDFQFSDELTNASTDAIINLSSVSRLAPDQLIAVKGQVVKVSGVKNINTNSQGKLRKQEILIRDTTACMKVILWEEYVDTVECDKTYEFKHLRVKGSTSDRYLNTPKSEPVTASECDAFWNELVPIDQGLIDATSLKIPVKILGIRSAYKKLACVSCRRKVEPKPNGSAFGTCQSCKLMQPLSTCDSQWTLRLFVQNISVPSSRIHVTLAPNLATELMVNVAPTVNLSTASEDDIAIGILSANKSMSMTYDTLSFQVDQLDFE